MKKKLLSVLLIGGMVTTILTGCAGEAKKEKENKEVEISFYTTETGKDDMSQKMKGLKLNILLREMISCRNGCHYMQVKKVLQYP